MQDAWRVQYAQIHNGQHWPTEYVPEGVWLTPAPMGPEGVAIDVLQGATRAFLVPGDGERYPLKVRFRVFSMHSGKPVEVASAEASKSNLYAPYVDGDGKEVPAEALGTMIQTSGNWSEARR